MARLLFLTVILASFAFATPVTINDACFDTYTSGPYAGKKCNSSTISPLSERDVIGDFLKFDIEKMVINELDHNTIDIDIHTNYGTTPLDPFVVVRNLNVGDLLFEKDGVPIYGVPLHSRTKGNGFGHTTDPNNRFSVDGESLTAGTLYEVLDPTEGKGLLHSDRVTGLGASNIRVDEYVWLQQIDGSSSPGFQPTLAEVNSGGSITVTSTAPALYKINFRMDFAPGGNPLYYESLTGLSFNFSSATCANDIIKGRIDGPTGLVPEPATYALLGGGLISLFFLRRRKGV